MTLKFADFHWRELDEKFLAVPSRYGASAWLNTERGWICPYRQQRRHTLHGTGRTAMVGSAAWTAQGICQQYTQECDQLLQCVCGIQWMGLIYQGVWNRKLSVLSHSNGSVQILFCRITEESLQLVDVGNTDSSYSSDKWRWTNTAVGSVQYGFIWLCQYNPSSIEEYNGKLFLSFLMCLF